MLHEVLGVEAGKEQRLMEVDGERSEKLDIAKEE